MLKLMKENMCLNLRQLVVAMVVVLAVSGCIVLGLAEAATYYVDYETGNDNNDGLFTATPWKHCPGDPEATGNPLSTIVTAGDTILFKGGVNYNGTILIINVNVHGGGGHYKDGTLSNWVELKSGHLHSIPWGSGRAIIDGENTRIFGFSVGTRSNNAEVNYTRITGFEIRNMADGPGSSGILLIKSQHCEIIDNLIHHIAGSPGASGYGIALDAYSGNCLVEKNEVYHVEEKGIELYRSDNNVIQYNYIHHTRDHGMVVSAQNNVIRNNIIQEAGYSYTGYGNGMRPAYGFKFDSGTSVISSSNDFYNNIIFDCSTGIGILNGQYNNVFNNTVYYVGWDDMYGGGSAEMVSFAMYDDGTAGSNNVEGNVIKNNIFYYSNKYESLAKSAEFYYKFNIGNNNVVQNNLIYLNSNYTNVIRYGREIQPPYNDYHDIAWFESSEGFSNTGLGNIASGNVMIEPNMKGGVGEAILTTLPVGFDSNWIPNNDGLKLTDLSPDEVKTGGLELGSLFDIDIEGNQRTGWSLGAYEYVPTVLIGDLNNDNQVNIQDIQACVNHILHTQSYAAADVNGDSSVNVLDVQAIVNIILSG